MHHGQAVLRTILVGLILGYTYAALEINNPEFKSTPFDDLSIQGRVAVRVILIDDGGDEDVSKLSNLLERTLPDRTPQMIMEDGESIAPPTQTRIDITYQVKTVSSAPFLSALKRLISTGTKSPHVIPISSVQQVFEDYIQNLERDDPSTAITYNHFVINIPSPAFLSFNGNHVNANTRYLYTTSSDPERCAANHWVGRGRYLVSDVSKHAIRCAAGNNGHISSFTDPLSTDATLNQRPLSFIVRLVTSAVEQVLVPDFSIQTTHEVSRILAPIIVLRNHQGAHPFGHNPPDIRITEINRWAKAVAPPGIELHLLRGVHNVHEHHHISLSISKCTKFRTFYTTEDNHLESQLSEYLDSQCLHHQLRSVEDILASGLVEHDRETVLFNRQLSSSSHKAKGEMSVEDMDKVATKQGVRVVPVYVLSTRGGHKYLDNNKAMSISDDSIIILRDDEMADVSVGQYCTDPFDRVRDLPVSIHSNTTTHLIIRSLTSWLGGLVDPTRTNTNGRYDYTWSQGYHPFHTHPSDVSMGDIFRDISTRNAILSRVVTSAVPLRGSLEKIIEFSTKYMHHPILKRIKDNNYSWKWIDQMLELVKESDSASPVAAATVSHLNRQFASIQRTYSAVSESLLQYKLSEALQKTSSLSFTAKMFEDVVHSEIEETEAALFCCSLDAQIPEDHSWKYVITFVIFMMISVAVFYVTI